MIVQGMEILQGPPPAGQSGRRGHLFCRIRMYDNRIPIPGWLEEVLMKRKMLFLSVVILAILVLPPDPADVQAAGPQDVMADYWVLTFEDGRAGWANLVSDDYAKTSFSSKGKVEVPGFKQVDI